MRIIEPSSIHCRYQLQTEPQPCYLYVDLIRSTVRCDYSAEIGGAVSQDQWHGHIRAYRIPTGYRVSAQADLLAEALPLAERIARGYECCWDGNNYVARLGDDARTADEELTRLCEHRYEWDDDVESHWSAADWYAASGDPDGLTESTTDAELQAMIAREDEAARRDGQTVDDIAEWIMERRDALRKGA